MSAEAQGTLSLSDLAPALPPREHHSSRPVPYRAVASRTRRLLVRAVDALGYRCWNHNNPKPLSLPSVRSLTFLHPNGFGDVLLTLPWLRALRQQWDGELTVVCYPGVADWLSRCSFIDRAVGIEFSFLVQAPFRPSVRALVRAWRQLHHLPGEVIYEMRSGLPFAVLLYAAGTRARLGGLTCGGGGFLFERAFDTDYAGSSRAELYGTFFRDLGIVGDPLARWSPEAMPLDASSWFHPTAEYVTVHVGAGFQAKRWPPASFAELVRRLARVAPVVLLGTETDLAAAGRQQCGRTGVTDLVGRLTLGQMLGVISGTRLHVGLDTGATHGAALLGRPFVALYSGSASHRHSTPFYLYPGQGEIIQHRPPCSGAHGCGLTSCVPNICMTSISVEEVMTRVESQLRRPMQLPGRERGILSGTPWPVGGPSPDHAATQVFRG